MKRTPLRTLRRIVKLARTLGTKKELRAAGLRGAELDEAWRIFLVRKKRRADRSDRWGRPLYRWDNHKVGGYSYEGYLEPRRKSKWEARKLVRNARRTAMEWPIASSFGWSFAERIAARITSLGFYQWEDKIYCLTLRHIPHAKSVEVKGSRSASSYTNYFVKLGYDLLRQEAVWIGGLLTFRAKEDAGKDRYPVQWLERKKDGPGLTVHTGYIQGGTYHVELNKRGKEKNREPSRVEGIWAEQVPRGWGTRRMSIQRGNCPAGTDNFINNKIVPHLQKQGWQIGNLNGVAFRMSMVLAIQRDEFTLKLQ